MKIRLNLRSRVVIAFILLTLVISSAFALSIRYAFLITEEDLINKYLQDEVEDFIEFYKHDKSIASRPRSSFTLYLEQELQAGYIPANILGLAVGFHEVHSNNQEYHVFVRKISQDKLYFVFDLTDFEDHEAYINKAIFIGVILAIFAAIWLGLITGNKVISPVRKLASQVNELHSSHASGFSADAYANDEVGMLAHEFEAYISRLQAFLDRERNFTGDVSHELRTPLTVITGAAEVLLAKPDLAEKERIKIRQIHRAGTDMAGIITAFLLLAREPRENENGSKEICNVYEITQQQMEQHQYLLVEKPVIAELHGNQDVTVRAAPQLLSIIIGNLLRNAYTHTNAGSVKITVAECELIIEDTGPGIKEELRDKVFERSFQVNNGKSGGSGIGLSIAKRLCDRYNWTIRIKDRFGGGTSVRLKLSS